MPVPNLLTGLGALFLAAYSKFLGRARWDEWGTKCRIAFRGENGPIHRCSLEGGDRRPLAQAGNVAKPFPRLRDHNSISRIHIRMPEDWIARLRQDHDPI